MQIEITNSVDFTLSAFDELDEDETKNFFNQIAQKYTPEACAQWAAMLIQTAPENAEPDTEPEPEAETPAPSQPETATNPEPANNAEPEPNPAE